MKFIFDQGFHPVRSRGHWTNGGSGITNFEKRLRPIYQAAIKEFGDHLLVIRDDPFGEYAEDAYMVRKYHSLHYTGGIRDLSAFWRIYERLKKEAEE